MSQPKTPITCSNCSSTNVTYTEATMSGLDLINLVSGETKFNYHCQNCHNQGTKWGLNIRIKFATKRIKLNLESNK